MSDNSDAEVNIQMYRADGDPTERAEAVLDADRLSGRVAIEFEWGVTEEFEEVLQDVDLDEWKSLMEERISRYAHENIAVDPDDEINCILMSVRPLVSDGDGGENT